MNQKPVLLWDGDCAFCSKWIKRFHQLTGDTIIYMPYQVGLANYPEISLDACKKAVQLIDIDGSVYSASKAVIYALKNVRGYGWLYSFYINSPLFAKTSEALYRWVARNRKSLSRLF